MDKDITKWVDWFATMLTFYKTYSWANFFPTRPCSISPRLRDFKSFGANLVVHWLIPAICQMQAKSTFNFRINLYFYVFQYSCSEQNRTLTKPGRIHLRHIKNWTNFKDFFWRSWSSLEVFPLININYWWPNTLQLLLLMLNESHISTKVNLSDLVWHTTVNGRLR